MQTPVCSGQPRSASRVVWQIVKALAPGARPKGWSVPEYDNDVQFEEMIGIVWPFRTHLYVPGVAVPVIYTYRHPVEAFLSFQSRIQLDHPDDIERTFAATMREMGKSWTVYRLYKADAAAGRPVLFLRYEDFYFIPEARILTIADFMEAEVTSEKLAVINESTSIDANIIRGRSMAHHHPDKPFSNVAGEESGMQRFHVNESTRGEPGKWREGYPKMVEMVQNAEQPAFEALKEMCLDMGYEV